MTGEAGGDISFRNGVLKYSICLLSCNMLNKYLIIGPYFHGRTAINRIMECER